MTARAAAAFLAAGLWLAACAAPRATAPAPAPLPAATAAVDPSDDWHSLVRAPFGTPLRATPFPLHEVLLFHDAARETGESRDCYGLDGAPPRFLGAVADEFVMCYEHDRLTRIGASVSLPPGEAPAIFARACASWLARATAAETGTQEGTCEGRDHGVAFSGRLAGGADEPAGRVSMTLDAPQDPPGTP